MSDTSQGLGGFSKRIDSMLSNLDHAQIVMLSYCVSAFILLCLVFYIVMNGKRQKAKLAELEQAGMTRGNKTNVTNNG